MHSRVITLRTAWRSLVATLEITSLATAAHVLAGGVLPSPGFLLTLGAVLFACSLATFGRVLSVATVVPVVLISQIGLHAAFTTTETMPGMSSDMSTGSMGMLHLEPAMLWAHLVTAVVTAIILLAQERALAAVVSWLHAITTAPAPAPAPARTSAFVLEARGTRTELLRTSPRRGPPALLALPA